MIWNIFSTIFSNPQIHYDDTFNSDTSDVTTYIDSMVTHLQAHFCQISLGTQIQVEVSILWYLLELCMPIWYSTDFCKNLRRFAHNTRNLRSSFSVLQILSSIVITQRVLNRWSKLSEQKLRFFSRVKI